MNRKKFITSAKSTSRITQKDKSENKEQFITFILLCDMPGYRMKSYGSTSLININDQKLIDIQIEAIERCFNKYEIIICTGFDADNLCKYIRQKYSHYNIRIVENQLFNNSNSCESLRLCLNNTNNNKIFVIDGSLLFNYSIFYSVDLTKNFLFIEEDGCENLEIGVNINENDLVEHFSFGSHKTWSEIIYFNNPMLIESVKKLLHNIDYKNKLMFEVLNDILKLNHKIHYVSNQYPVQKINNIKKYKNIKEQT